VGDIVTRQHYSNFKLHVEFWIPLLPATRQGQDRGNSGVFLQDLYELQILDPVDNPTYFAGSCGSLYKQVEPLAQACLPPEQWQSYDINFVKPVVSADGTMVTPGVLTVDLNQVRILDHLSLTKPTGSRGNNPQGRAGPIVLQDHGSPVRFRNIWIEPLSY